MPNISNFTKPSFPTVPAFIHTGDWDDTTRSHPAMKWMEPFTRWWDSREWTTDESSLSNWATSDFALYPADGSSAKGTKAAYAALKALYGPLAAHLHEPTYLVASETEDGWEMLGQASFYADLGGEPGEGEKKVKDGKGREWDMCVPSAFHIWYVKDEKAGNGGAMLIKKEEIMTDSGVGMRAALKRGLVSAKDMGL